MCCDIFYAFSSDSKHRINIYEVYFAHYHNVSEGSIEAKSLRIISQ